MKMKNSEVLTRCSTLAEIIRKGEKYPVKFSFALVKNLKALQAAGADLEEARNALLDCYNVKDADGKPAYTTSGKIEIAEGCEGEWKKSMQELLDIEVEVPVHPVSVSVLDGLAISADTLYNCDFMLTE